MRRTVRTPAWLLILAGFFLFAGVARAAHVHDPAHSTPQQLQHCDLCHAFETSHAPPAHRLEPAGAPRLVDRLLPAVEAVAAAASPSTSHRPRGPPAESIHA